LPLAPSSLNGGNLAGHRPLDAVALGVVLGVGLNVGLAINRYK
jgi:hypothetical protein